MIVRITKTSVDALNPGPRPYLAFDETLKGFGVRVMPTGAKSYIVEYRPGAGGRGVAKRRMSIGAVGVLTPDEARRQARVILANVARGEDPAAARQIERDTPTFAAFATQMLDDAEAIARERPQNAVLKLTTIGGYRSLLKKHIGPEFGSRRLTEVSDRDVTKLHARVGKTSPAVANRILEFVGRTYRVAAMEKLVERGFNPARDVRAFKEHAKERFLSGEELARLGEAIREAEEIGVPWDIDQSTASKHTPKTAQLTRIGRDAAAVIRLLIFTGARLREVLHAKWSEIDLERGFLTIIGKTGRRHIFLPPAAVAILAALPQTDVFVFPGEDSTADDPKPRADINRPWRAVRRHAGLGDVRLHDLRHSFASIAAAGGASLFMIGKLLGHASPVTTQRYAHLAHDPVRAVAESAAATIAAALSGTSGADIISITPLRKSTVA